MAKAPGIPAAKLELYEKLVANVPGVDRKGASMPYTSCNGHMFSFLCSPGTMALRLPEPEREAFLRKYKTKLCVQHGHVMKEYVIVPDSLLKKTTELKKHFQQSLDYVRLLKPKPTTRKKAAKKKATKKKATKKKAAKKRK